MLSCYRPKISTANDPLSSKLSIISITRAECDYLPDIDAFQRKKLVLREGPRPVLLDTVIYPIGSRFGKSVKVLLACDAVQRRCLMQTVAANLTVLSFDDLDGPPVVVGAMTYIDLITPDVLGPSAFHGLTVSPVTACTCRRSGGRRAM